MFEKLKQKIKHYRAEKKEADDAYKAAQNEESLRLQHLSMQKKMEQKKQRIASASEKGIKSKHRIESMKQTAKEKSDSAAKKLKELSDKHSPLLIALAKQAALRSARYMLSSRPKKKRRKKTKKGRY